MDLLEYQAKELFQEVGIPILSSQPINNPSELKRLNIPYPVVLKSQVRAGGRGKAGGVRFVENTIDAIAAAHSIFNLPIMGEYPSVLLAEARYNAKEEFFLAVLLDYHLQRPVLLGSVQGGMDINALLKHLERVVIEEEFSPFYARRLATKMGLQGALLQSVSVIVEKMYYLFESKDLDLVEINPLGVSADGEVMALDGKITINDHALARHPELSELLTLKQTDSQPFFYWLDQAKADKNIAIICNSFGLGLATWDLIIQEKGNPACCLVLEESYLEPYLMQQLKLGLEQLKNNSDIKVIFVNLLGNSQTLQTIIEGIAESLSSVLKPSLLSKGEERISRATGMINSKQERMNKPLSQPRTDNQPYLVMRLVGTENLVDSIEQLSTLSVYWLESLEESVSQAISLAKT